MNTENKRTAERLFRYIKPALFLVGVVLFVFLIRMVGARALWETTLRLSPAWVAGALFFWAVNILIASARFRALTSPDMPYFKVVEVVMGGYLLNYASMAQGLGIGAKVALMKGHRVPTSKSVAGAGGEVIFDLIFTGIVTLVFVGFVGAGKVGVGFSAKTLIIIAALIVAMGIIALIFAKHSGYMNQVVTTLKTSFTPRRLPFNLITSAGIWTAGAASYYCMIRAAGASVPPLLTLAALCVGFIVGFISLVPGGLGARDVTWAYVCSAAGAPLVVTGTAALALRVMGIVSVALVLGVWTLIERRTAKDAG